jgi:signal transduction histidine kinase
MSDKQRIELYYTLSYEYGLLNPRKGIAYAKQCLDLATKTNYKVGTFYAFNGMGNAYESMANFDSALWCHLNSYKYAKLYGTDKNQTSALVNIGICYKEQGNYANALRYFLWGFKLVENKKDYNARIHYYLGEMYYMLGNYEQAIHHSRIGYRKLIENKTEYIAYNMNVVLAKCKLKLGKTDSAIFILNNAKSNLKNYTDQVSYCNCLNALGEAYFIKRNFDEAIKCFSEEIIIQNKMGNQNGICLANLDLAKVYAQHKPLALDKIKWHVNLAESNLFAIKHNKDVLMKSYEKLASIYETIGMIPMALSRYKHYFKLKDELLTTERYRQIGELQTKYATEKKEKQILKQSIELKNKSIRLERNRLQILLLFVTIAFLILFGYFYYQSFKLKQKLKLETEIAKQEDLREKALKEKENEERTRIAKDIHDELGSGLSKINLVSEIIKKEDIRNPLIYDQLNSISETSTKLVENMRDLIWVWNPENNQLDHLIARIREYSYNYLEDFPLKFEVDSPENIPAFDVSSDMARQIYMLVKEILQNIVKHANANKVCLQITLGDYLTIVISDNGRGFNSNEEYRGNGLKNLNSRCEQIGAYLQINSELNKGTNVTISLELRKLVIK